MKRISILLALLFGIAGFAVAGNVAAADAGIPSGADQGAHPHHVYFVVKTSDGQEEMRVSCDEDAQSGARDCVLRATQFVVPDTGTPTQFSLWSRRLAAGNDSLRDALCKGLHLIDPKVRETREIVDLLKSGCGAPDGKRLSQAYAKMDTLSGHTCILINREEYLKFTPSGKGGWVYAARHPNACLESKTYAMERDSAAHATLAKTFEYTQSRTAACAEARNIDKDARLRESADGHIEIPSQCHYLYLQ